MCMVCLACYEGARAPAFPLPPAFISSHRITRAYEDRAGLGKSTHSIWACSPLSPQPRERTVSLQKFSWVPHGTA